MKESHLTVEGVLERWISPHIGWTVFDTLEARVPEEEFQNHIETLLTLVRDRPIILGIGDAVMSNNEVERVRWIVQRIEEIDL